MIKEQIGDCLLYNGDALEIIPRLSGIDAVVTDPPYSSGGAFRSDRTKDTSEKYQQSGVQTKGIYGEFSGDNRDQRAFLLWCTLWLSLCLRASKPGAVFLGFTDWRQLPTFTDAVQCGGWVWRNVATWWKPGVRMQKGRFSSSSEFIVYASKGGLAGGEKSIQNVLQFPPKLGKDKRHIAEKPMALMETILGLTPGPGDLVLDPFMGSGTTGEACLNTGRRFIGIEMDRMHFERACERIHAAQKKAADNPRQLGLGLSG